MRQETNWLGGRRCIPVVIIDNDWDRFEPLEARANRNRNWGVDRPSALLFRRTATWGSGPGKYEPPCPGAIRRRANERRSEVDRAAKEALVAQLHDVFKNTGVVVVTHYAGLSVAQMSDFRNRMRDAGGQVKVAKNRLARIALENTDAAGITDLMKGPTCLAYSEDPIAAAKVAVDYAKGNDKLVILGGAMGDTVLDSDGVKALAALPSLDELRGKMVGLLQAPLVKIVQILNEPGAQVARVIQAKSSQGEAA